MICVFDTNTRVRGEWDGQSGWNGVTDGFTKQKVLSCRLNNEIVGMGEWSFCGMQRAQVHAFRTRWLPCRERVVWLQCTLLNFLKEGIIKYNSSSVLYQMHLYCIKFNSTSQPSQLNVN